jgi:hypothetical protein
VVSGSSVPCAWPWNTANSITSPVQAQSGGLSANAIITPRTRTDVAMPDSTHGSGIPEAPSRPPSAMVKGKANGTSQSAGRPICAAHKPTASIART